MKCSFYTLSFLVVPSSEVLLIRVEYKAFLKSIYFGELGILPVIGNDCYQQERFFVCEFRSTYDIKLTSACNGLLLFAKEEYKIYRSGNVVGGLSGIGKN